MPIDPFGGEIEKIEDGGPYESALNVLPNDDEDLPVIPAAICLPPLLDQTTDAPSGIAYQAHVRCQMFNGTTADFTLRSTDQPLKIRPRRILMTGSTPVNITLLW